MIVDAGAYGGYLSYAMTIFLVGSALIIFIYLWSQGKLDMDEEPKLRMMEEEDGTDEPSRKA